MTDHAKLAYDYFMAGCNCSQAVFCAFEDRTGLDHETSLRLASSFGGGFGRLREVCGAFSGAAMVAGLLWGYTDLTDKEQKAAHYALIQEMAAKFREENGSIICRELLEGVPTDGSPVPEDRTAGYYQKRPCPEIVYAAAEILDQMLAERQKTAE